MISCRRLERLREQLGWRWRVVNEGPNRHERRKYLVQLRRTHRAAKKESEQKKEFVITDPDEAG